MITVNVVVYCIKSKSETASCLKEYVNLVENKFNKRVKKLNCDNGKEYLNKEIYQCINEKGIELLPCAPYVYQLRGYIWLELKKKGLFSYFFLARF